MTPPFLLYSGRALIQVYIFTPGLRCEIPFVGPGALFFSAIAEFIAVALAAYGTGKSQSHVVISLSDIKLEVTKVVAHRRDAKSAEVFYKEIFPLRALRLCGETIKPY
jgi:hypothetical protein